MKIQDFKMFLIHWVWLAKIVVNMTNSTTDTVASDDNDDYRIRV